MYDEYIDALVDSVGWRIKKSQIKSVEPNKNELLESLQMFSNMYQLLLASEKLTLTLFDNTTYNLFVWKSENGIGGWLCEPRTYNDISDRPAKCKLLQSVIGNVIETFGYENIRVDWLCNLNWFLGDENIVRGLNEWKDYFFETCQWDKKEPILKRQGYEFDIDNLMVIAEEANGNLTLCDVGTEEIFLFAHDHCFDNVAVCGELPEYTFYTINNAENFVDYIELIAKQWRSYTSV